MQPDVEIAEGELLPDVIEKPAALGLFGTDDPDLVIVKAVDVSNALARVIRDRDLFARISGKEHVLVGGWTLLGSMLGVFPVCVWSRPLEDGWEARVEARTRDGASSAPPRANVAAPSGDGRRPTTTRSARWRRHGRLRRRFG